MKQKFWWYNIILCHSATLKLLCPHQKFYLKFNYSLVNEGFRHKIIAGTYPKEPIKTLIFSELHLWYQIDLAPGLCSYSRNNVMKQGFASVATTDRSMRHPNCSKKLRICFRIFLYNKLKYSIKNCREKICKNKCKFTSHFFVILIIFRIFND